MIVIYTRIYIQIRKRARSEVINRCSDIRPDSFSGNSDPSPSPVRYALATHNRKKGKNNQKHNQKNNQKNNQKKKQKKKKEENLEDDPAPEEFSPMEMQVAPGASSCNASCDG